MKFIKKTSILMVLTSLFVIAEVPKKVINKLDDIASLIEEVEIDAWLSANRKTLNMYGDPIGTSYLPKDKNPYISSTGGFNQIKDPHSGTMRPMTIYEYIKARNPKKPWETASPFKMTSLSTLTRAGKKTECIQVCEAQK